MKRRWLISKDARRCGNYHCSGYDKTNHKTVLKADGTILTTCRECGKVRESKAHKYKERRPCIACQWVRDVVVNVGHDGHEWSRDKCSVCEMEISARHHLHVYNDFTARVAKARRLRAVRSQCAQASNQQGEGT